MSKAKHTIYFTDNGVAEIYKCDGKTLEALLDDYGNKEDEVHALEIEIDTPENGYAQEWLTKLAELYGFDVGSV